MFLANCGYLELVLVLFIMNSPLQFCIVWLIPVMIANLVRGSRMTVIGCGDEILLRSRQADVMTLEIFLGESCVLLINSSIVVHDFFCWIKDVNLRFNYIYELV